MKWAGATRHNVSQSLRYTARPLTSRLSFSLGTVDWRGIFGALIGYCKR